MAGKTRIEIMSTADEAGASSMTRVPVLVLLLLLLPTAAIVIVVVVVAMPTRDGSFKRSRTQLLSLPQKRRALSFGLSSLRVRYLSPASPLAPPLEGSIRFLRTTVSVLSWNGRMDV